MLIFFPTLRKSLFLRDKIVFINLGLTLTFNFLGWFFLYWRVQPTTDFLALHYNLYFGVDMVGEWWRVFYLPLVSLLCALINIFLAKVLYRQTRLLSYFLMTATSSISIIIFVGSYLLILLNGF